MCCQRCKVRALVVVEFGLGLRLVTGLDIVSVQVKVHMISFRF